MSLCVCVRERRSTGGKSVLFWFTCGQSGFEGSHSCSIDAITTISHWSIWQLCSFSFFIAVFTKLAGSADYFLALYKTCYVLCSIRFVMQETTEPRMFRKFCHRNMEIFFLSCTFITETMKDPESLKQVEILFFKVILFFFHNFAD